MIANRSSIARGQRIRGAGLVPAAAILVAAILLASNLSAQAPAGVTDSNTDPSPQPSPRKRGEGRGGDARASARTDAHSDARADALFARWKGTDAPGCSAAVSLRGAVVYARGFGGANLEYSTPITPASVFHVASVSKQFTAMSILLLAQQGKLSLDDDVKRHMPEWAGTKERVTIRQLLNHTSGLRDVFLLTEMAAPGDRGLGTAPWLISLLARQRGLNFSPGSEWQYNNGGYLLLADIVARVSGQPLPAFAKAHIFEPLGMTQTFFHDDASLIVKNRATGYIRRSDGFRIAIGFDSLAGNGGLFTTPRDLLRWEQNFVTPRVGDAALLRSMETATPLTGGGTSPYGFGLQVTEFRGRRAFGHGGGDQGASAYTLRFPDDDLAVAVACNIDEIDTLTLALDLADVFLGKRATASAGAASTGAASSGAASTAAASSPLKLSAEQLSKFEGLYRDPSTQSLLRMFVRDGTLMGSSGAGTDGGWAVAAQTETRFIIPYTTITLEFQPDASGRAQTMRVAGEKPQPFTLERLPDKFEPPRGDLTALTGRYANAELDVVYTIESQNDELTLRIPARKPIVMQPIFRDGFVVSYLGVLVFTRDTSGAITGFTSHTNGVREIRFERVRDPL